MPPPRRLVRDPYSRLGGVASGIAHYYGLDVSLVRLLFVVLTLASGFGLLAYLLGWLIIPRADYWPPAGPARPMRSLSNRDLGIGLAVLGVLIALALGGHATNLLVPVVLVGGGIWLLVQHPAQPTPAGAGASAAAFSPAPPAPSNAGGGFSASDLPPAPAGAYQAGDPYQSFGAPVPPRSGRRRFAIFSGVLGFLLLLVAIPVIALIALAAAVVNHNGGAHMATINLTPATVAQLPGDIREGGAELTIDLTALDHQDYATLATPPVIHARVDAGRIEIILPEGVNPSVQAESQLGQVVVFDQTDDGIRAEIDRPVDRPDLVLQLDVGAGEVLVHHP